MTHGEVSGAEVDQMDGLTFLMQVGVVQAQQNLCYISKKDKLISIRGGIFRQCTSMSLQHLFLGDMPFSALKIKIKSQCLCQLNWIGRAGSFLWCWKHCLANCVHVEIEKQQLQSRGRQKIGS